MPTAMSRQWTSGCAQCVQIRFRDERLSSGLTHDVELGAGVSVRIDVFSPERWQMIEIEEWNNESRTLVELLIGVSAAKHLQSRLDAAGAGANYVVWDDLALLGAEVDLAEAQPWLRLAAVEALDRWLHLPLERTLVDAERASAWGAAALSLPDGRTRQEVLTAAVRAARTVALEFADYLGRISRTVHGVSSHLVEAIDHLVEGYRDLQSALPERDPELWSVLRAGREVSVRLARKRTTELDHGPPSWTDCAVSDAAGHEGLRSLLDPRQVPARLLDMSAGDDHEVAVRPCRLGDLDAVEVEVAAYPALDAHIARSDERDRLMVRLVDVTTGAVRSEALLTFGPAQAAGGRHGHVFRGVVPLGGLALSNVRADVFDALIEYPAAVSDTDPQLLAIRHEATLLHQRRAGLALRSVGVPGRFWSAGVGRRPSARGPGGLLLAELAAAHGRAVESG
jgi:hypothetical protein